MSLLPDNPAVQHKRAPRPLPLFLDLVRRVSDSDPALARAALAGVAAYRDAERPPLPEAKPTVASAGPAALRDHGGDGAPLVMIPSLINPPYILDLDRDVSLTRAAATMGRRVLLVDWGEAGDRANLDVAQHVEQLLLPLLASLGEPAALLGYCLGGTMAIAAANLAATKRVITLATPWHFARYPDAARAALANLWSSARAPAEQMAALPIEVLQAAFWSLDPARTVTKFARFGALDPASPEARRFVALEDWANNGEAVPFPAARELIEDLFGADVSGHGQWRIGGQAMTDALSVPMHNLTARDDRIAPAATAPRGDTRAIPAGHVGMIVGHAREMLHAELARALSA